ncbi:MAG: hypothetical protein AAF327_24560 [Cyanobacteria bacterium P01_A01_bin.37]
MASQRCRSAIACPSTHQRPASSQLAKTADYELMPQSELLLHGDFGH